MYIYFSFFKYVIEVFAKEANSKRSLVKGIYIVRICNTFKFIKKIYIIVQLQERNLVLLIEYRFNSHWAGNNAMSEQAPGSGFHPRDESEDNNNYCGFWDLIGAIKR